MAEIQILSEVKTRLGITGTFHDALLSGYINDTKSYLKRAGVSDTVLNGEGSIGVISRGVADLWNFGSGEGKLSPVFYDMATQLVLYGEDDVNG